MYGSELFTLTPSLLEKLERCQLWFIRNILYVPKFTLKQLLLKLSGLNSIESEIAIKKIHLGRFIWGAKTAPVVRSLFESRTQSYFDTNIASKGVLPSICEILHKYDLFGYFESWFSDSTFPTYLTLKTIVMRKIHEFEEKAWNYFVCGHPNMQIAQACLENVSPHKFWSISEQHPDLVSRLHIQIRLMGSNFGLNGGIPWFCNTDGVICFLCKVDIETVSHFLLDCPNFREHFDTLWANLTVKVTKLNDIDGRQISEFIGKLDRHQKALLLLGCLRLPFDAVTITMITRFIAAAVGEIYKLCAERLHELEAPWLPH